MTNAVGGDMRATVCEDPPYVAAIDAPERRQRGHRRLRAKHSVAQAGGIRRRGLRVPARHGERRGKTQVESDRSVHEAFDTTEPLGGCRALAVRFAWTTSPGAGS